MNFMNLDWIVKTGNNYSVWDILEYFIWKTKYNFLIGMISILLISKQRYIYEFIWCIHNFVKKITMSIYTGKGILQPSLDCVMKSK